MEGSDGFETQEIIRWSEHARGRKYAYGFRQFETDELNTPSTLSAF
jgi:hypothetical protein